MKSLKKVVEDYKLLLDNVPALVTLIFVMSTIIMNFAAGKVIFNAGPVAVTGGFVISYLPFLCMDVTAKRFGARAAILLNILSAVGNVLTVILLSLIAAIPTKDPYIEFNYVFGSVWFIVFGSTVAFVVSGIVNSLLNAAVGKLFKNRTSVVEFFSRSFISTFVGQAVDNFLFLFIVYVIFAPIYWGTSLPVYQCIGTAILGGLLELVGEMIFAPWSYKIVKRWEKDQIGKAYIDAHSTEKTA